MKPYLFILLLFYSSITLAQNKGKISGTVKDANEDILEKATISLINSRENNFKYVYQDYIAGIKFYWKPIETLVTGFPTLTSGTKTLILYELKIFGPPQHTIYKHMTMN